MYDLIIIGGGPAGLTAAAYGIRKRLDVLLISEDLGGKAQYHLSLRGLEGHEVITGEEVASRFKNQIEYLNYVYRLDKVVRVDSSEGHYQVHTRKGGRFEARAIIVATGAMPQFLEVPGEERLRGKGLSYSAVSHASLFLDRQAAIVGSGDVALRGAAELSVVADWVYLIAPTAGKLDSPLGRKLRAAENVTILQGYQVQAIKGWDYVEGLVLRSAGGGERELEVDGVLVELDLLPSSDIVAHLVRLDEQKRIIVDTRNRTSRPGLFAAGDVTDVYAEQVLVAIGEGAKAALSAYEYLLEQ
jgi:thioredoxin reductase